MATLDLHQPLSPHFTLSELLRSETAERIQELRDQQLDPPSSVITNLRHLVTGTLEPMRQGLGLPLRVTSGYRCLALNRRVGGTRRSQHVLGQAADLQLVAERGKLAKVTAETATAVLDATGKPLRSMIDAEFILFAWAAMRLDELDIDQLIHEYGSGPGHPAWVHVSSSPGQSGRRQILIIDRNGARPLDVTQALELGTDTYR